jgi:hypothetical protein
MAARRNQPEGPGVLGSVLVSYRSPGDLSVTLTSALVSELATPKGETAFFQLC